MVHQIFHVNCNWNSIYFIVISCFILQTAYCFNEINRCCNDGSRTYAIQGSCPLDISSMARTVFGSSCSRAASVCCLKSLFEKHCTLGEEKAQTYSLCVAGHHAETYGAGYERKCCECCLLAKQMIRDGRPCQPLSTFDTLCKRSFENCCRQDDDQRSTSSIVVTHSFAPTTTYSDRLQSHNRCWTDNPCEQLCEDHGHAEVNCACKPGYRLNSDGRTCSDIDECSNNSSSNACDSRTERCINSIGSFECVSSIVSDQVCATGMTFTRGQCTDVNECQDAELVCDTATEICTNTIGSFECVCKTGFVMNSTLDKCVDMDECVLERDNKCSVGQRCINTVGSYKCIRTMSCGTGYYLDSDTEDCKDIDECALSTHNCGPTYSCRNTKGSFRCEKRVCQSGQILDRVTGLCKYVRCEPGFVVGTDGKCHDVDECGNPKSCRPYENCVNTPGSFHCVNQNSVCREGYEMDRVLGQCVDVDECLRGTHRCYNRQYCRNTEGSYICECQRGYTFNRVSKQCEDVDECDAASGNVCSFQATCENTAGSFRCICKRGYVLAADQRTCEDVDECRTGEARCQQRCVNVPGSYQCVCDRGYTLALDGHTCQDIDECALWHSHGSNLCIGQCINTPGSYTCSCPKGFRSSMDGRTCDDIDECAQGECRGDDRICVNTLGSYRCHIVRCPESYVRDLQYKNRGRLLLQKIVSSVRCPMPG